MIYFLNSDFQALTKKATNMAFHHAFILSLAFFVCRNVDEVTVNLTARFVFKEPLLNI